MSFFSDLLDKVKPVVSQVAAPAFAVGGGLVAGPAGAQVGENVGTLFGSFLGGSSSAGGASALPNVVAPDFSLPAPSAPVALPPASSGVDATTLLLVGLAAFAVWRLS